MKLSGIIMGILFLGIVMTSVVMIGNSGASTLGTTETLQAQDVQYNETVAMGQSIEEGVRNAHVDIPVVGDIPLLAGAWKTLSLAMNSGKYLGNIMTGFFRLLQVPAFLVSGIVLMVSVAIMFLLLSAAMKRDL